MRQMFREEGEIGSKSREEGEIGSESREKGDLLPCSFPLYKVPIKNLSILISKSIFLLCQHALSLTIQHGSRKCFLI